MESASGDVFERASTLFSTKQCRIIIWEFKIQHKATGISGFVLYYFVDLGSDLGVPAIRRIIPKC